MSDIPVPSYRIARDSAASGPPWRMLAIAGGVVGAVALGGAAWWGISKLGPRSVPLIEADSRPIRVRPEDPGGLRVANQDEIIFERGQRQAPSGAARLAPEPEGPAIDRLRAQVAVPPEPAPAAAPRQGAPQGAAPRPGAPAAAPGAAATPGATAPQPGAATPAAAPQAATPQPAPVAPPAAARPAPAATGRVLVQLGAVGSEDGARAEWDRLARRMPELLGAFQPRVAKFEREGQATLWRLRTGAFADAAAARDFCEKVRARGSACVVVGG